MSMLFDRYLSEEFDEPIEKCFEDLKNTLAVKKKGSNTVLYYIYGDYVVEAVMRWFSLSDKKKSQLKKDYLKWLVDNHKKFTLIDDTYFVYEKTEVKRMKKEIIAKSNKIFINGEDK